MPSANAPAKINHSTVECKSVKMTTRNVLILIFLSTVLTLASGFEVRQKRQSEPEDCSKPPIIRHEHECCRLPKERIWGDLRKSFVMCNKKIKQEATPMRQELGEYGPEMMTPKDLDLATPTENPNESASTPSTASHMTTPVPDDNHTRPHWRKPLSERLKHLISTVIKEIKNTFTALWQSVVIITDHHFRRTNDSCFIECVFEDQGFLMDKMVNKAALLERLAMTLAGNEPWHKVAAEAVETCYQTQMTTPSNRPCNSKSEEVFRCIFKHLFFNCPNWIQDDYCASVKEFYQKCPNGPPPEINDQHTTAAPELDEEVTSSVESLTERSTESE